MLTLKTLFLVFALSLLALPGQAAVFWDDEMEQGTTGFNYQPNFDNGNYTYDTVTKYSGTGSIRVNLHNNCDITGPGTTGQCGGSLTRSHPDVADSWSRFMFRISGSIAQGSGVETSDGIFHSSIIAATKVQKRQSIVGPGTTNTHVRGWLMLGKFRNPAQTNGARTVWISEENVPNWNLTTDEASSIQIQDNRWYCIETRDKVNTPGLPDGIMEIWVDGVRVLNDTNVIWQRAGSNHLWHEYSTMRQNGAGSMWYDKFAAGDSKIGCPGASQGGDVTPPSPPTAPTLTTSGGSVNFNWVNGTDLVAVANAVIRRCLVVSPAVTCTPTVPLTTVSASNGTAGTYLDANVLSNSTYFYTVADIDTSSNISAYTTAVGITTPNTFRVTLATDDFNRANDTDMGPLWDAGYTANDPLAIQSNQVRVATLNKDSLETYNGVTTPNDQWSQITLSLVSGSGVRAPRALVRFSNPATINGYECGAVLPSTYRCVEWNTNVATVKTTATWTWAAGDKMRVEAEGTAIRGYVIRGTTETLIASFTDTTHTSGKTGIIHYIASGSTSNVQIDDFAMGGFQSTAATQPSITALILDPNGADIQVGAGTAPTKVRVTFGTNNGSFSQTVIETYATAFTNGRYNRVWLSGMQFACFVAIDSLNNENNTNSQYQCGNLIDAGVPPIDQSPPILTNPFPTTILPAGTLSATIGFTMNKDATCRFNLTDVSYDLMTIAGSTSNLTGSTLITGLSNGYSVPYYYRCLYVNPFDEEYANLTSGTILLQVDTITADTTLPDPVTNVVANPVVNSSDVSLVFDETGDDVAISHYDIYKATDLCLTYVFSGSVTDSPASQTNLAANTFHCFKMKGVDTSGNESLNFSNVATVTTGEAPDIVPPLQMRFKSIVPATTTAEVEWEIGFDNRSPTTTQLEYCQGELCFNWTFASPLLSSLQTIISLVPDTFYRLRGRHFDLAGNAGPYSEIQEFRTLATETSEQAGIGVCNCRNQHDARH